MSMPMVSAPHVEHYPGVVGRRAELDHLRRAVEAVREGRGGATVVVGEPGIGKSRLLAEAASEARAAGLPTFPITPPARPRPWTGAAPAQAVDWPDVHSIADRLANADRAVVIADDIHLIPPGHMSALADLVDLTMSRPLLLVTAYRPRQIPCALGALLARASDAGTLHTLFPEPLTLAETSELLGNRPDLDRLHPLGAGNPLYLQALADSWGSAGIALVGELSVLSLAELQTARTAAVIGDRFTSALLAAAAPDGADQALADLDRLVAADIIRPTQPSPQLAFRHPVLARIIYDHIGVSQRRAIHLRIEAALAESQATMAQRAHHVAHAADPALPSHVETLLAGAHEVLERDPASAAAWLATACSLMAENDPRWAGARLLLARAQLLQGSPSESRRVLHDLPPDAVAPQLMSTAAVYFGQASRLLGRPDEARAQFEKGLASEEASPSADSVIFHSEIADIAVEASDFASAVHHATVAIDLARSHADRPGEAGALSLAALAHLYAGQADSAHHTAALAARLVDEMSDASLIRKLACLNWLGMTESALEQLPDAERHLIRGLELSRRTGQTHIKPDLLKTLADVQLRRGHLVRALDTIEEARVAAEHDTALSALVETMYAEALLWQANDPANAIAAAERAIALCDGATAAWAIVTGVSSADILIRAGELDRGIRLLTSTAGGPLLPQLPAARRARSWESLVVAAAGRGDAEIAEELTNYALADPDVQLSAARRGYVLRTQMHTAGMHADIDFAVRLALTAGESFATAHMYLETGRTLADVAEICLDAGDVIGAYSRIDEARDLALRCGSQRLLDQIDHLRRRLDELTADDVADIQLSDRELQVATLARTGMRSKDIASQLFVSVRTIDSHLSRIYRKLGISTRIELARINLGATTISPAIERSGPRAGPGCG